MTDPGRTDPDMAIDDDRTVIRPWPGKGLGVAAASGVVPSASVSVDGSGVRRPNPLVQAAGSLLVQARRLRTLPRQTDARRLRRELVQAVKGFDGMLRHARVPDEQVVAARYLVCALLDEIASRQPWGGAGAWASQSLLLQFHHESSGSDKVFQLLSRLAQEPERHLDLLELIQVVLSNGFQGRYAGLPNGRTQLDQVIAELADTLRTRDSATGTPAAAGAGLLAPRRRRPTVRLWLTGGATVAALLGVFIMLRPSAGVPVEASTAPPRAGDAAPGSTAVARPTAAQADVAPLRLAQALGADIAAGRLAVRDLSGRSVITLPSDHLFAPGSSELMDSERPLLLRVASALGSVAATFVVSGHTDGSPINAPGYLSDWHLSKARALSVREVLATQVAPARLSVEGRADTEPVDDNGSAEGRERNRRVVITVTPLPRGAAVGR